jgi:hypothetical protein
MKKIFTAFIAFVALSTNAQTVTLLDKGTGTSTPLGRFSIEFSSGSAYEYTCYNTVNNGLLIKTYTSVPKQVTVCIVENVAQMAAYSQVELLASGTLASSSTGMMLYTSPDSINWIPAPGFANSTPFPFDNTNGHHYIKFEYVINTNGTDTVACTFDHLRVRADQNDQILTTDELDNAVQISSNGDRILVQSSLTKAVDVTVTDMQGKELYQSNQSGNNAISLTSPTGFYIVRAEYDQHIWQKKVFIQK